MDSADGFDTPDKIVRVVGFGQVQHETFKFVMPVLVFVIVIVIIVFIIMVMMVVDFVPGLHIVLGTDAQTQQNARINFALLC